MGECFPEPFFEISPLSPRGFRYSHQTSKAPFTSTGPVTITVPLEEVHVENLKVFMHLNESIVCAHCSANPSLWRHVCEEALFDWANLLTKEEKDAYGFLGVETTVEAQRRRQLVKVETLGGA
jgi:hypothetical protein